MRERERERMEMTQMRREDDDMIELHKTPGSRCRDDTLMEISGMYMRLSWQINPSGVTDQRGFGSLRWAM